MKNGFLRLAWPVVLGVALAGCAKKTPPAIAAKPAVVRLAPIAYSDAPVPVRVSGVLSRKTEAELSFKIGGVIDAVLVRPGDMVKSGEVLARLRSDEIDAQVAQARSALAKTQRDLGRIEKLEANCVATLENLQDARTAVDVAAAQLRIVEFNQRFAVIVAPAGGRILRRLAEPNETVGPSHGVVAFAAENDGWIVRAGLADRDAVRVRVSDRAEISAGETEAAPATGHVTQISEATEAATRTTPVEIALDAVPAGVRSGTVVVVAIVPEAVASRAVVPASALIEGAGSSATLFVVDEGAHVARRIAVEVEVLAGTAAYLRTELPRTARLVVSGGEYLRDGASVVVAGE